VLQISNRLFLALILLATCSAFALPGIQRVSLDTKHFEFSAATEDLEQVRTLAPVAEAIWDSLAAVTGFSPPVPVHVVVRDEDDYSNGYAIPFANWVSIWESPIDFEFRGGTRWRTNVLAHELSHIFTMRALGYTSKYLGNNFFVEGSVSPISFSANADVSTDDLESWLAEGLAQYGAERCGADHWDAHRDMLERIAWLSGAIQPLPQLVTFTGDYRESEGVYNQGYSFIRFVMSKGALNLQQFLEKGRTLGIRKAIEFSLSTSMDEAFAMWQADLRTRHGNPKSVDLAQKSWLHPATRLDYLRTASPVQAGADRYFLSSHENDNGMTSLYQQHADGDVEKLATEAEGRLDVDLAHNRLLFIRLMTGMDRRSLRELFSLNLANGEQAQLTENGRVVDMASTSAGVFFIGRKNGHNRLYRLLEPSTSGQEIFSMPYEYEFISVAASEIPGQLYLGIMGLEGYRICLLNLSTGRAKFLFGGTAVRDPRTANGYLYAAVEYQGRYQIGRIPETDLAGSFEILTNEVGGAFQPSVTGTHLQYTAYGAKGFFPQQVSLTKPAGFAFALLAPAPKVAIPVLAPTTTPMRAGLGSGNSLGFLGCSTQLGFMHDRPLPHDSGAMGDKFLFSGGIIFADPSQENQIIVSYTGLKGAGGTWGKGALDHGVGINWQSDSWSPSISLDASLQQYTVEYGPDLPSDLTDNPRFMQIQGSASAQQVLGNHISAVTQLQRQAVSYISGANSNSASSLSIKSQDMELIGIQYQDNMEKGRYGMLSGGFAQLMGGLIQFQQPYTSTDVYNEDHIQMVDASGWLVEPSVTVFANLFRSVITSLSSSVSYLNVGADSHITVQAEASWIVPLPRSRISFPVGSRALSLIDPRFVFGVNFIDQEADSLQNTVQVREIRPGMEPQGWQASSSLNNTSTNTRARSAELSASFAWKVITFGNASSMWAFGIAAPFKDSRHLAAPTYSIQLSF